MSAREWGFGVIGLSLGVGLVVVGASSTRKPSAPTAAPFSTSRADDHGQDCDECDGGECVLGRCVAPLGCSQNSDCDDGLPCTIDWCESGRCRGANRRGGCGGDDDAGSCQFGFCEPTLPNACSLDTDCGVAANPCIERACVDGACLQGARADDVACTTAAGRAGECRAAECVAGEVDRRVRFSLSPDEVQRIEHDVEVRLANNLRYDLKAVLVELNGGGYNIVLYNRRSRAEVRGLCDPSFIAFDLASYTGATDWKSNALHIWLEPGAEGWAVPTRGSRLAVDQARANSVFGAYGVADVRTLRVWLERAFSPLHESNDAGDVAREVPWVIKPLPVRVDAGLPSLAAVDAGPRPAVPVSGKVALTRAWDAFGEARMAEARKWLAAARAQGVDDPELGDLLSGK